MGRRLITAAMLLGVMAFGAPPSRAATIALAEVGLNINGVVYGTGDGTWSPLPGFVNTAAFDDTGTGLGSIILTLTPGNYDIRWLLDVEILDAPGTPCDETVTAGGAVPAGGSYEADEPGWDNCLVGYTGDIYTNFTGAGLENALYAGPNDMALALGRVFSVGAGETAVLRFVSSLVAPAAGFYLEQSDAGGSVFAYSTLDIRGGGAPEPATLLLFGLGLLAAVACARRRV